MLGDDIQIKDSVQDCITGADAVLITTPDPAFTALKHSDFRKGKENMLVVDFWRVLAGELSGKAGVRYVPVGHGTDIPESVLEKMWTDSVSF